MPKETLGLKSMALSVTHYGWLFMKTVISQFILHYQENDHTGSNASPNPKYSGILYVFKTTDAPEQFKIAFKHSSEYYSIVFGSNHIFNKNAIYIHMINNQQEAEENHFRTHMYSLIQLPTGFILPGVRCNNFYRYICNYHCICISHSISITTPPLLWSAGSGNHATYFTQHFGNTASRYPQLHGWLAEQCNMPANGWQH